MQCEEFMIGEPQSAKAAREPATPGVSRAKACNGGTPDHRMGLCSNCDELETCTFPDARQGVLHCEEYR